MAAGKFRYTLNVLFFEAIIGRKKCVVVETSVCIVLCCLQTGLFLPRWMSAGTAVVVTSEDSGTLGLCYLM